MKIILAKAHKLVSEFNFNDVMIKSSTYSVMLDMMPHI